MSTAIGNIAKTGEAKVLECLRNDDFAAAERLVRKMLPEIATNNLKLMSFLQMALNGQESTEHKLKEADQIASTMKFHWEKTIRPGWIKEGRPKDKATFAKKVVNANRYQVVVTEYYEAEVLANGAEDSRQIEAYYKILITPHQNQAALGLSKKLFKLVKTSDKLEDCFELKEFFPGDLRRGGEAISYGGNQPDFRTMTNDVVKLLDGPAGEKSGPTIPEIV
jgi:hypothetical protein